MHYTTTSLLTHALTHALAHFLTHSFTCGCRTSRRRLSQPSPSSCRPLWPHPSLSLWHVSVPSNWLCSHCTADAWELTQRCCSGGRRAGIQLQHNAAWSLPGAVWGECPAQRLNAPVGQSRSAGMLWATSLSAACLAAMHSLGPAPNDNKWHPDLRRPGLSNSADSWRCVHRSADGAASWMRQRETRGCCCSPHATPHAGSPEHHLEEAPNHRGSPTQAASHPRA